MMSILKVFRKNHQYKGYVLSLILSIGFLIFNFENDWPLIQKTGLHAPGYADLYSVLLATTCSSSGYFPWQNLAGDCQVYWYGNIILVLSQFIHFSTSWTPSIATVLISATLIGLLSILSPQKKQITYLIFTTLVIWSPSIHLLFERANLDTAMFLLVLISAYFASRKLYFSSILILAMATLMKFYTLPLLWIVVYLSRKSSLFTVYFLTTLLVTFDVVIEYARLTNFNMSLTFDGIAQFGASELDLYFGLIGIKLPELFWLLLGNLLTLAGALLIVALRSRGKFLQVLVKKNRLNFRGTVALFSAIVFLFCYASGKNYDYRLIFMVSFIITAEELIKLSSKFLIAWRVYAIAMLWFNFVMYSLTNVIPGYVIVLIQLFGDMLIGVFASILVALLLETLISWYLSMNQIKES